MNKHIQSKDLKRLCQHFHSKGKKIVFTYGTYDLIHGGHAAYLLDARMRGDVLIVGVANNKSKRALRGKGLPLIDQKNRAELLGYFKFVDYTTIVDVRNLLPALKKIKPDVFFTLGVDWRSHLRKPKERQYVKKYGGTIIEKKKNYPYVSSSAIATRVADLKIKQIVEYFFGKAKIDLSKGDWGKKKWSGLKTEVRSEVLHFGHNTKSLNLFARNFWGETVDESELQKLGKQLRKEGKKIVLSSGACDILHIGHGRFFEKAKEQGDVLFVAIPSNKVVRKQKGTGRPIVDAHSRAELVGFLESVDYTTIFNDDSVLNVLKNLKPDIYFTVREDWNRAIDTPEAREIKKWGGKIVVVPPQSKNISSTKIIRKAAGLRVREVFKEVLQMSKNGRSLVD